jgi:hypothetical protein
MVIPFVSVLGALAMSKLLVQAADEFQGEQWLEGVVQLDRPVQTTGQ